MIHTNNLTKFYGKSVGLLSLNLTVKEGEIFGFLGPNGAGKTTTIRLLLDFIKPTNGTASIFGYDTRKESVKIKEKIGYLPGDYSLYDNLTGEEIINYIGKLHKKYNRNKMEILVERFDVDIKKKLKRCSKGMKQKIQIILAFMNNPELLILDEPTSGLDPLLQQEFYKLLSEEKKDGKTIFLSSHILSEVEKECDRIAIIKNGKLVIISDINELKEKRGKIMEIRFKDVVDENFLRIDGITHIKKDGEIFKLYVHSNENEIIKRIAHYNIESLTFKDTPLEDIFLEYYEKD